MQSSSASSFQGSWSRSVSIFGIFTLRWPRFTSISRRVFFICSWRARFQFFYLLSILISIMFRWSMFWSWFLNFPFVWIGWIRYSIITRTFMSMMSFLFLPTNKKKLIQFLINCLRTSFLSLIYLYPYLCLYLSSSSFFSTFSVLSLYLCLPTKLGMFVVVEHRYYHQNRKNLSSWHLIQYLQLDLLYKNFDIDK